MSNNNKGFDVLESDNFIFQLYPFWNVLTFLIAITINITIICEDEISDYFLFATLILYNPISPILLLCIYFTRCFEKLIDKETLKIINMVLLALAIIIGSIAYYFYIRNGLHFCAKFDSNYFHFNFLFCHLFGMCTSSKLTK
eukprot:TRINITY_DN1386_c0_g1_i2.p1 TRINITY_DN1386_c0_g1~~TRINITY_DN1386_c0_g1_i2.p1  ORF type:complete len:142 (-),score=1.42 TRINITY_DN1386_c0_g1_i2:351-776(-)